MNGWKRSAAAALLGGDDVAEDVAEPGERGVEARQEVPHLRPGARSRVAGQPLGGVGEQELVGFFDVVAAGDHLFTHRRARLLLRRAAADRLGAGDAPAGRVVVLEVLAAR